jgi:hypothetical protein
MERMCGYALSIHRNPPDRRAAAARAAKAHTPVGRIAPGSAFPLALRHPDRRHRAGRGHALVHHNPRDFETIRMAIETSPDRFPTLGPLNLVSVLRLAGQ